MGLVVRGTNQVIRELELSVTPLPSIERGEAELVNSITNGQ